MSRYVAQFRTPSGRLSTIVASNETLKDLCQGYAPNCGRPARAHGELVGVTVMFPGRKPPFLSDNKRVAPKAPIHTHDVLAMVGQLIVEDMILAFNKEIAA